MANTITHIKIGNVDHIIASSAYAICLSPADRVNKEAFIKNDESFHFTLTDGITLHVKFRYTNTASRPTLNINNTGAKALYIYGTTPSGTTIHASSQVSSMTASSTTLTITPSSAVHLVYLMLRFKTSD